MDISVPLLAGAFLTATAFAFKPLRKTIGLFFFILGSVVSFRGGFIIGVPIAITGGLLSFVYLLYQSLLDIFL